MQKKVLYMLAYLLLGVGWATAQVSSVTGTVTSADDGEPVIGASVLVKGTTTGTVTNLDGNFTLQVPAGAKTLVVSYIGFQTQEVAVAPRVAVALKSDDKLLDEVVVTGYTTQRRASFTGAAAIVDKDALAKKTDASFMKSLEGAVPGVQMNNASSMPGTFGTVFVRGRGSLSSGTAPLYVIDGVPVNAENEGSTTSDNNNTDPMSALNPADIENVTILKDAAATAIYGSRAGNGVIVITTKKGAEGATTVNFEMKQGAVSMGNHNMDYADAKSSMDLFAKGWVAAGKATNYKAAYKELTKNYRWDGSSSTDWIDAITRTGHYQDYNLNISGRTGKTGYYLGLGYLDTKGIVIASDFARYSGRLNVDSKFNRLTVGANTSFSYSVKNGFAMRTNGAMSSPLVIAVSMMKPFYKVRDEKGNYLLHNNSNPVAMCDPELGNLNRTRTQVVNLSPYMQLDLGRGFYAKTTLGVNLNDLDEYNYYSALYSSDGRDVNGMGEQYDSRTTIVTWTNIAGWLKTIGAHDLNIMLGQEMQRKNFHYHYSLGKDFPFASSGMRELSTAGKWSNESVDIREARLASYFMDAHYSYANKYYASLAFRRDGSSVFGSNHRWGNFWSVGGKWRITGEEFLKDNRALTNAMLRVSYGTVGNQDIDWYAARGYYSADHNYNSVAGIAPEQSPNPELTWETSKKFDVGIDLSFFSRYHLSVDFYNENTSDALYQMPLSRTTGFSTLFKNIAAIRNQGLEVALNGTLVRNKAINWTAYVNMTYNQNKVIELADHKPVEYNYTIIEEGRPYRQFKMKEYAGVDSKTGKPLWYLKEEGNETTSDYNAAAKRYAGSADPKVYGGFGTSLTWKGFDASLTFNYRLGNKVFDSGASFTGWGMADRLTLKRVVEDSWTPENKGAKYPQYIFNDPYKAAQRSTRFVYSGDFLRISNLTLGYTLPASLTKQAYMNRVRLYASVDNLYTFFAKDFVGYNPETYDNGYIGWQYPASRTFIGGVQVTF